jgi:cell division transport system permease protein
MEIFLSDEVPDDALPAVEKAVMSFPEIDTVGFISKDEAASILKNEIGPGILDGLDANPLPRSFVIFFDRPLKLEALDNLAVQLKRIEGVDAVEFGRPWIEKVEHMGRSLHKVGYIVGGVILFVVLLTMANTNRLTARTKSRDFFQLNLLGAGPSYILYPFLAEGFLAAVVAAVMGWGILYYLSGQISFSTFILLLPEWREVAVYSLAAGVTGIAGAYLGIRRLLIS